jgi:molybdopterin-guanine dinucleotide biosynthesis protein A
MSKSDDLRAIIAAMSARPWRQGRVEKHHVFVPCAECLGPERVLLRMNEYFPHEDDAAAIAALANHAEALVGLVRAAERLKAWDDGEERSYQEFDAALDGIMCALRRVHEIGDGT